MADSFLIFYGGDLDGVTLGRCRSSFQETLLFHSFQGRGCSDNWVKGVWCVLASQRKALAFPPLSVWLGLLLIAIGVCVGIEFQVRVDSDSDSDSDEQIPLPFLLKSLPDSSATCGWCVGLRPMWRSFSQGSIHQADSDRWVSSSCSIHCTLVVNGICVHSRRATP